MVAENFIDNTGVRLPRGKLNILTEPAIIHQNPRSQAGPHSEVNRYRDGSTVH